MHERGLHGRGARFIVAIPPSPEALREHLSPSPEPPGDTVPGDGRPRVLLIDDERSIRLALSRFMRRRGWDVEEAQDGAAGVALLESAPPEAYDLVVTDLRMPVMSGFEVHDWLESNRPDLFARLVIATGDVASQPVREFLGRISRPVLEKPFELSALGELMERAARGSVSG